MTKTRKTLFAFSLWGAMTVSAFAQGTAFTYQGQLSSGGSQENGNFDVQFTLFSVSSGGSAIAGPVTNSAVSVTNGLFTTIVKFAGNPFTGASNFLELAVRTNGAASFSPPLTPRQQLTPTPYAVFAESANATNLVGTVPAAHVSGVALLAGGNAFTGQQTVLGGNVGIGLSNPNDILDVSPGGIIGNSTTSVNEHDPSNQGVKVSYGYRDPASQDFNGLRAVVDPGTQGCGNSGDLLFYTWECNSGTSREVMRINGTGNVGIGTTTPNAPLEVQTPTDNRAALFSGPTGGIWSTSKTTGSGNNILWDFFGNTNAYAISRDGIDFPFVISYVTGNVGIGTGTPANKLEVQGSADFTGNVGIGTTTPTSTLAVNGNIFFGTQRNNQVFNQIGDTLYLGAEQKYLGNTLLSAVGGSTDWINLMANPLSAGIMFGTSGSSTTNPHSNITALVVIKPSGNVGIGTASPNSDSQLQVNGMVRMGSESGTSEAPNAPIMVRRINSSSKATGQVVARSTTGFSGDTMTLERDGTTGGLVLKITGTSGGAPQIAGFGINASGTTVNVFLNTTSGLGNNTTTQIFTDSQRIGYCRLTFGDALNLGNLTTVEMMREVDSSLNNGVQWVGTVTSTLNQ